MAKSKSTTGRLDSVLTAIGAKLKRDRKHLVYELPNGKTLVVSKTPSDHRAELNAITDAKRAAGIVPGPAKVGVKRPRKDKPGPAAVDPLAGYSSPLSAALHSSGAVEQSLRDTVARLEGELAAERERADSAVRRVNTLEAKWYVRVFRG